MNIGTLNIEIATNVARIKADMDAAKQTISTAMKDVEQYVGYAKTAFIGLIGIGSVAAFKGMIDSAIEGRARLYQLSIQTGISVEALGAMAKVGKYTGTSIDEITTATNKLSKALFVQNEDSKGAAQAIKNLGLDFNKFKELKPEDRMLALAKAMDKFGDGGGKSATAMILLGKSGAEMLPFLKELAEKNELVGKVTAESAKQAHEYEKNLKEIAGAGEIWKRELIDGILPTLLEVTRELINGRKAYGGYWAALKDIGLNVNPFDSLNENITSTVVKFRELEKEATDIKARQAGGGFMANFWGKADAADLKRIKEEQTTLDQRLDYLRQKQMREENSGRGTGYKAEKPQLPDPPDKAASGSVKTIADGYEALIQKLRTKIDLDRQEIALGRQLTDSEKLQIEVYNEVEKNYQKLSIAKMLGIDETLQMALALGKERREQEANLKWMKEATDANATHIDGRMQLRDQMQQERKAAELLLRQYGMTSDELRAMESARLRDAAAALERDAVLANDVDLTGQLTQLYREQALALRGTAEARDMLAAKEAHQANDPLSGANRAVKEYLADVKRAGDATYGAVANAVKGLEDLTVTALMGGDAKTAARAWVSGILSELYRLGVVKPFFAALFGKDALGGGGGLDGLVQSIGSLFGGGKGGGGGYGGAGSGGDAYAGFAKGDVFDRATPFRFASGGAFQRGIMGEVGPEAVMPLTRGSDGKLGVVAQGGGGSRQVMVNVINNGSPVQAKSSQRETSQGTVIDLVLDAVAADMAGGGKVHDATQRRFGLNPGGSTPRY